MIRAHPAQVPEFLVQQSRGTIAQFPFAAVGTYIPVLKIQTGICALFQFLHVDHVFMIAVSAAIRQLHIWDYILN